MAKIAKGLLLFLVSAFTVSSLMPIMAQSISKPATPEFSLNVTHQNDGTAAIEIVVKNQPLTSSSDANGNNTSLYYNVRFKGHYSADWNYYSINRTASYIEASTTDYTTIAFTLGSSPLGDVPAGGRVDFQLQALIGYDNKVSGNLYDFAGESSSWSNTQTVTVPETTSSTSPTPTAPPLLSTQVSISIDTSSSAVGASVNIHGELTDINANALPGKPVTLSYSLPGSGNRVPIGSDVTNAEGEYTIQWVNTASGMFTLTVEWSGDSAYQPSSNTTSLNFLPYENQNIFLVESNSTVTAFAYNSTNAELSFIVTGASDTAGYAKVTLSKSLTANPENIKVYLDGKELNYSATSNVESWQLTFSYHHSTHLIAISLESESAAPFFQTQLGLTALIGVAIAILMYPIIRSAAFWVDFYF